MVGPFHQVHAERVTGSCDQLILGRTFAHWTFTNDWYIKMVIVRYFVKKDTIGKYTTNLIWSKKKKNREGKIKSLNDQLT